MAPLSMKQYAQDSVVYSSKSLFSFPPNPFPAIVLISAIYTTVVSVGQSFWGNGLLNGKNWILLIGTWCGHHAMLKNRMRAELEKMVEKLRVQLGRLEEQLKRWETITKEEEGKVEGMQKASETLKSVQSEFKEVVGLYSTTIRLQQKVSQEYLQLMVEIDGEEKTAESILTRHLEQIKQIEKGLDKRLELIKEHQAVQFKNIATMRELLGKIKKQKKGAVSGSNQ
ncbi:MAG: hypothetical protein KDK71_00390 [Chlamydiia bacterium]|nr:hypothetical protein [Chlamydiia bacterium]